MKLSFLQSVALAGLLGCCSGSRANSPGESEPEQVKPALLPIRSVVLVKEIRGQVEYAYDSTGWKLLTEGKELRPGATVRAASGAVAILRLIESSNFFKVSSSTAVHITNETPLDELVSASLASARRNSQFAIRNWPLIDR